MEIPLDEVVYFDAISSSSTGAAADADSTPTFAVYEEATDTDIGIGGNMTKRTSLTGNYRGSFTASAANGFELGKWYVVIGSATIGAIACKGVLRAFRIVAAEIVAGYPPADTLKVGGTTQTARDLGANLDAAITTRMATYTQPTGFLAATFPSGTIANTTNITAGTITNVGTLTTYTGNTPQTGDAFARIGAAGAGLTALGDARIANLDATVSSRMATFVYTAPPTAADIRTAVGLGSANLDTQLAAIDADVLTRLATVSYTAPDNASVTTILGQTGTTGVVVAAASKTGYALSATGLDAIAVTDPGVPSTHTTLPKMLVALWRRFFKKSTMTATELATYADDGTTKRGKAVLSDDLTTQTVGAAADGP